MLRRYLWLLGFVLALAASAHAQNRYVEAGAPAPDRAWAGSDYEAFTKLLASGAIKLPTLNDPDGREIFARLVNPDNLEMYRSTEIPAVVRLQGIMQSMGACKDLLLAYVAAANKRQKVARETAASMAMLVRVMSLSLVPADEIVAATPENSPQRAQVVAGVKQMKSGVVETLAGAEVSLGERDFYSEADLAALVEALAECVPTFVSALSTNQRVEFRNKFKKRKAEFTNKAILAHLDAMIETLLRAPVGP